MYLKYSTVNSNWTLQLFGFNRWIDDLLSVSLEHWWPQNVAYSLCALYVLGSFERWWRKWVFPIPDSTASRFLLSHGNSLVQCLAAEEYCCVIVESKEEEEERKKRRKKGGGGHQCLISSTTLLLENLFFIWIRVKRFQRLSDTFTYSFHTPPFIHSFFARSFIHSFIHPLIHSFIHHPFAQPPTRYY